MMFKLKLNKILFGVLCMVLLSCNTYKGAKKSLLVGDYDKVITSMTNKYAKGVNDKNRKRLIPLLHEAYIKANARDLESISRHQKSADIGKYRSIYLAYNSIQSRQDKIKPLLPIKLSGKPVDFPIKDYSTELENYKAKYAKSLYNKSITLLDNPIKPNAQEAYGVLMELEKLYPNYLNLRTLQIQAYRAGTTFIYVAVRNSSEYLMPKTVDENLRSLDTRYLNRNWNEFHTILQQGVDYDYDVLFDIQNMDVSAERISRNQFTVEKEIVDGWEYEKDEAGEIVLDSLNNKIKVDIIKTVSAEVIEKNYAKSAFMKTKVVIINNITNQIETTRVFESEQLFSQNSTRIIGDEQALDDAYRGSMNTGRVYFPSDSDMLFDCTSEVKSQVKHYLKNAFK